MRAHGTASHLEPARHPRVVPRDGEIRYRVEGVRTLTLGDAYHAAMTVRWPMLLACIFAIYVAANVLFAVLYRLGGDCIASADPDSFADALWI